MKLRLDMSATGLAVARAKEASAATGDAAATAGRAREEHEGQEDGILISSASTALMQLSAAQTTKIERVAGAVAGGSYQDDSAATGNAIVSKRDFRREIDVILKARCEVLRYNLLFAATCLGAGATPAPWRGAGPTPCMGSDGGFFQCPPAAAGDGGPRRTLV